jgi:hypothetical protein
LNLEPKNSGIFSKLQHQKNQAVTLMNSLLYMYIHCLYAEFAICLVLHGASKNFTLSFMVKVKQFGAAS